MEPGSSVHGILQTRILEWVAILFSRGSSQPRDRILVSYIAGGLRTIWVTREALLNLLKNFFRNVSDTHFTQPHKWCSSKESVCQCWRHRNTSSVSGLVWSLGVGNGNLLQYSCLKNSMDRGTLWATVLVVVKSWTWISTHTCTHTHSLYLGF